MVWRNKRFKQEGDGEVAKLSIGGDGAVLT
jgi:hypothetical protein